MTGPTSRSKSGRRYTIEDAHRAARLAEWLATKRLQTVSVRQVCQFGPSSLRRAHLAREALELLADYGYVDRNPDEGAIYDVDRSVWDS